MKYFINKIFLLSVLACSFKNCQAASFAKKLIRLDAVATAIKSGETTGTIIFKSADYSKPVILGGISSTLVSLGQKAKLYVDFNVEQNTIVLGSYRSDVQSILDEHKVSERIRAGLKPDTSGASAPSDSSKK